MRCICLLDHFDFKLLYICTHSILMLVLCLFQFYIRFNHKPITVYQSSLDYLHLLIHGNCLYELAAHVRATPLRRALNSRLAAHVRATPLSRALNSRLAAHVRATPLRRALNSRPVNITNVFLMFYLLFDFYCTTVWRNK